MFEAGYSGKRTDQAGSRVPRLPDTRHRPGHGVPSRVRGEEPRQPQVLQLRGGLPLRPQDRRFRAAPAEEDEPQRRGGGQGQLRLLEK